MTAKSNSACKNPPRAHLHMSGNLKFGPKIRWRRMIRKFTIRNRDSRRLVFLNFLLRVKDLVNSDCRFGFLVKNCIYSQLEMSRILNSEPKIRNVQTLVPKNVISYRMSSPYYHDRMNATSLPHLFRPFRTLKSNGN